MAFLSRFKRWHSVNDEALIAKAHDTSVPLPWRVYWYAVAHSNKIGHTQIEKGMEALEIAMSDADGVPPTRSVLKRAVKTLVDRADLLPGSDLECLIVDPDVWATQRQYASAYCVHHGVE